MTTYVISVPGTFTRGAAQETRDRFTRALRPADPHRTHIGSEEDLDILSVNDDGTFTVRLTIDADTGPEAVREARRLAEAALGAAGLDDGSTPLGPAVITGIDSEN